MTAIISPCGNYRYRLDRPAPFGDFSTAIIMVNPSTADAHTDDATIRKLRGFADRNAWGHLIVGNLFAWRAKDVRELGRVSDPVGPDNDAHLTDIMLSAQQLIVAWGPISKQPKYHRARWRRFMELVRLARCQPLCIGEPAKCGHPKHPLMLGYDSPIIPWKEPTP